MISASTPANIILRVVDPGILQSIFVQRWGLSGNTKTKVEIAAAKSAVAMLSSLKYM